jgi:hypothetical protein
MRAFALASFDTPRGLRGDLPPEPDPDQLLRHGLHLATTRCQGSLQHWQGARAKADRMVLRLDGAADPPPFRK